VEQSEDELDEPEIKERVNHVFSEQIEVCRAVEVMKMLTLSLWFIQ
jgi:hypothetical protein